MANYTNHSRFIYTNYDEIQNGINNGVIDINDIIYTKDTHENIIISPDYKICPVQCRVYRFSDVDTANSTLNKNTDTYAGQIVAILGPEGNYSAYIVNKKTSGNYSVDPLNTNSPNVNLDYNELGNRPIQNLYGDTFSPAILDIQNDGIYKVFGSYKISNYLDTIFYGGSSYLFLIEHQENDLILIKRIGAKDITDFIVSDDSVSTSVIPTEKWIEEQGFATENYVYTLINNMNLITKEEINQYVTEIVNANISNMVHDAVENEFNSRFQETTESEALDVFVNIFK